MNKQVIESRAYVAARRIFGRYGIDILDENVTAGAIQRTLLRMNPTETETIMAAFGAVMTVNGRIRPPAPEPLAEEDMYDKLQKQAYHFKQHPEDLPKVNV